MNYFMWSTVVLSVWGALGPLFGIWYGHRISHEGQKKQWLFDKKREEYREVIQVLSSTIGPVIQCIQPGLLVDGPAIEARHTAENLAYETLGNRIFIAAELDEIKAYDKWVALLDNYEKKKITTEFTKSFGELIREIRTQALKSMEI